MNNFAITAADAVSRRYKSNDPEAIIAQRAIKIKDMSHLLLHFIRHINQSKPIEHPINVSHSPDIAQSFGSLYYFFFYISQCQNYRTPCQTLTLLPAVDPQLFRVLAVSCFVVRYDNCNMMYF